MKKYLKIIVICIIVFIGIKTIVNQIIIMTDKTINCVDANYGDGDAYEIPKYFGYQQVKLNIYSYNNGWDFQKSFTIDKKDMIDNQFIVYFDCDSTRASLDRKLVYPDIQVTIEEPIYILDDVAQGINAYRYEVHSIYEREVNYDENPLSICIRIDKEMIGDNDVFSGFIDRYGRYSANFNNYELSYPIKILKSAKATLVTYQLIR